MKNILTIVIAFLSIFNAAAQQTDMSAYQPKLKVGEAAPDFTLPIYNSEKKVSLADFKGKYVLLDFWASWCGDCRREMPVIEETLKEYQGKVQVLSVSFDRKKEALEKYLAEHPVGYDVACDFSAWKESEVTKAYQLGWIPTFYIIAPDGTIAGSGITGNELKYEFSRLFGGKCYVRGADISGITAVEDGGVWQYVNTSGKSMDAYELLKTLDFNAIRLRVWVNPKPAPNGKAYSDISDVVKNALRAKAAGMDVMIDFHYSNWWADPGKQHVPKEWHQAARQHADSISIVCDSMRQHTLQTLAALKAAGVTPKWVQIGNETPDGFMHPYGIASKHPEWFARLFKTGYDATKEVFPEATCICHIDNGYDLGRTTFILDILRENGVDFDLLGWSLYPAMNWETRVINPNWQKSCDECIANADTIFAKYGKESMLVEVGLPDEDENVGEQCVDYLINHSGKHLKGLIWWEPLTPPNSGYTMGAMKKYGEHQCCPNKALEAFKAK